MSEFFLGTFYTFIYVVMAIILTFLVSKLSKLLFNMDIIEEVRQDNKAAAILALGLFLMIGLIIGLTKA
jgi:uncharacterized membrane protein YjfL (UPF0719 family)